MKSENKKTIKLAVIIFLLACLTFLGEGFFFPSGKGTLSGHYLIWVCLFCSWSDIKEEKIPNCIVYPAFIIAILLNLSYYCLDSVEVVQKIGGKGFLYSFLGALSCFFIVLIPYVTNQGGAGDVKLAAVVGAVLGVEDGVIALLFAFVLSGFWGIFSFIKVNGFKNIIARGFFYIKRSFLSMYLIKIFGKGGGSSSVKNEKFLRPFVPFAPFLLIASLGMLLGIINKIIEISF